MTAQPKPRMTVEDYLPWALAQPRGRYELIAGEVVAQASERAAHNLAKGAIFKALDRAIRKAGLPCTVFTDGMTIKIDQYTAREPDAVVQCGTTIDPLSLTVDVPMIVVEVVSPSSERDDNGAKISEYFSLPSVQHYVIVDPTRRVVIHHARETETTLKTTLHSSGTITLTPPGCTIDVTETFGTS